MNFYKESMILIILIVFIVGLFCYLFIKYKISLKIHKSINDFQKVINEFENLTRYEAGYFNKYKLDIWLKSTDKLLDNFTIGLLKFLMINKSYINVIENLYNIITNCENLRSEFNKNFVNNELKIYKNFFDNIEGRILDIQQRTAIITDENNNLVIAGAGSGKTTTIVGKVKYIIDRYKINPNEILLLSFTTKSVESLVERVEDSDLKGMTFHKLGLNIINEAENKKISIYDSQNFNLFISKVFEDLINQENYRRNFTLYMLLYNKPMFSFDKFKSQGEHIDYLREQGIEIENTICKENYTNYISYITDINNNYLNSPLSYQMRNKIDYIRSTIEQSKKEKITLKKEKVKSVQEMLIANFLFMNNIDYLYELAYKYPTSNTEFRQYKPDFTLFQKDNIYYLEHFGINKDGNVPEWFASNSDNHTEIHSGPNDNYQKTNKKYNEGIQWKINLHKDKKTKLITTYSYEFFENDYVDVLSKKLTAAGLILNPKPIEEVYEHMTKVTPKAISEFLELVSSFICLLKSNNYTIEDVLRLNRERNNDSEYSIKRNISLVNLIDPIRVRYEEYLNNQKEIDFYDMVNKAARLISTNKIILNYKYIIIDEYQDFSVGRYHLIKAIKESCPDCKLFCVGDDWQSIYRFSGSDIDLFTNFDKYFGFSNKTLIETTYRFKNPLLQISSNFITKNPKQVKKNLISFSNEIKTEYEIIESNIIAKTIIEIFDKLLVQDNDIESKQIFILGRYSFSINSINYSSTSNLDYNPKDCILSYSNDREKSIKAKYLTVHKSKGLEADYVIIINCNIHTQKSMGFPNNISDDALINLLLCNSDDFSHAEERRLFYVALTRAKEKVFILYDKGNKSPFIEDIAPSINNKKELCPYCKKDTIRIKTGEKNGKTWKLKYCINDEFGCSYEPNFLQQKENRKNWKF